MKTYTQDPQERLDYEFDFSEDLTASGDTISSYTLTAETGLTLSNDTNTTTAISFLAAGAVAGTYKVTGTVTTTGTTGRILEHSIKIIIREHT